MFTVGGLNWDDVKLCNCAECGCELLGESMVIWLGSLTEKDQRELPGLVYCRVWGRPYCMECAERQSRTSLSATREEDGGPWQQNAVRALEDAAGDLGL